jgi:hypothetical protein
MKNILMKALVGSLFFLTSIGAHAALITLNGTTQVGALKMNESFKSFYNFADWKANTGYEKANELVAFFAYDQNDALGLYMIFGGPSGDAGSIVFDINGVDGSVIFVDDPGNRDPVVSTATGTNVTFGYIAGKTDGLIFSDFSSDFWALDIIFDTYSGIDGYTFLTFDSNGVDSVALQGNGLEDISILSLPSSNLVAVNSPSTIGMLFLALAGVSLKRRRK